MTALCGGGSSSPSIGAAAVVTYSSGLIAIVLERYSLGWLQPVIPLLGLPPLILNTFCSTDPPAVPTFTAAETQALLGLQFGANFDSGLAKFRDLVLHAIWLEVCVCDVGTPTPLTPPTPPAGTPIIQLPPAPAQTPCQTSGPAPLDVGVGQSYSFRASIFWEGQNVTLLNLILGQDIFSGAGAAIDYTLEWTDHNGGILASEVILVGAGTSSYSTTRLTYAGAVGAHLNVAYHSGTGRELTRPILEGWCDYQVPGGTQSPCCPPDTSTQAYLDNILKMVTLIQRQGVPFAYVDGTAHSGLTGNGEITFSGALGVRLHLTTYPARVGQLLGDPITLFDVGWIAWGNADGFGATERIRREFQLSFPAAAGAYTKLGYSLTPGVVATITEVLREP